MKFNGIKRMSIKPSFYSFILIGVLNLAEVAGIKKKAFEKVVGLGFDEMKFLFVYNAVLT